MRPSSCPVSMLSGGQGFRPSLVLEVTGRASQLSVGMAGPHSRGLGCSGSCLPVSSGLGWRNWCPGDQSTVWLHFAVWCGYLWYRGSRGRRAGCSHPVWGATFGGIGPGVASVSCKRYSQPVQEPQSCGGCSLSLLEDKCESSLVLLVICLSPAKVLQ